MYGGQQQDYLNFEHFSLLVQTTQGVPRKLNKCNEKMKNQIKKIAYYLHTQKKITKT